MRYSIELPEWMEAEMASLSSEFRDVESRMREVIRFSQLNIRHGTGGPFAAAVFEKESGKLVSMGVNRVVPCQNSSAHAEMVALSLAQSQVGTFDLGGPGMPAHELYASGRPCAMCFGAIPWSGVRALVVAAPGSAIEELAGFDEGPIHPDWQKELRIRGIEVVENILAEEACAVLREFGDGEKEAYNGRRG